MRHTFFYFILYPLQHKGPVLLLRIADLVLVYGERHIAPAIDCEQVVVSAQNPQIRKSLGLGLAVRSVLNYGDGVIAGGNSVEAEVPA